MTNAQLLDALRGYIMLIGATVYKDIHPPFTRDTAQECVVVNTLGKVGGSWEQAVCNVNWYVPDIITTHAEADFIKLEAAEKQLYGLFNHGTLIEFEGAQAYFTIDKVDIMSDEFSHYVNMRLKTQITNF